MKCAGPWFHYLKCNIAFLFGSSCSRVHYLPISRGKERERKKRRAVVAVLLIIGIGRLKRKVTSDCPFERYEKVMGRSIAPVHGKIYKDTLVTVWSINMGREKRHVSGPWRQTLYIIAKYISGERADFLAILLIWTLAMCRDIPIVMHWHSSLEETTSFCSCQNNGERKENKASYLLRYICWEMWFVVFGKFNFITFNIALLPNSRDVILSY